MISFRWKSKKLNPTFETRNRSHFCAISTFIFGECYLCPFQDEFQLNPKSAYIPKCIHQRINMYQCTSVVIRDF